MSSLPPRRPGSGRPAGSTRPAGASPTRPQQRPSARPAAKKSNLPLILTAMGGVLLLRLVVIGAGVWWAVSQLRDAAVAETAPLAEAAAAPSVPAADAKTDAVNEAKKKRDD